MSAQAYQFNGSKLKALPPMAAEGEQPVQPVVIALCGTFNPMHTAHICMYDAAKAALLQSSATDAMQRRFAVLGGYVSPVHDAYNKKGLHSFAERAEVADLCVASHPELAVDRWEGLQTHYIRTFYVLEQLEASVQNWYAEKEPEAFERLKNAGLRVRVVFACGGDLFSSFFVEGCWPLNLLQRLLDSFLVVVLQREGLHKIGTEAAYLLHAHSEPPMSQVVEGTTFTLDLSKYKFYFGAFSSPNNTSSTTVRAIASSTDSTEEKRTKLHGLIPDNAIDYVLSHYGYA
ncbi:nicotinamide mononucleotide adenylyltransferase [Strigomonas culicis]|uniref:Nicotinamide mononucleotide adenylyltransferase n=1 Tax=Strigomonas culicis TaxID=28005 RepID=S9UVU6_9TRYP|nr:nicotinamide-nucleotide adenylyltransferase [Strigomonas culicis]EPY35032.1 nicotinamide mononucleotide adenylyltransferase [Strigomonas culicis]|eukprot:EPY35032.1 nicotinamide mononucleotide adenylyltransferase [Strigomonas culicis]